MASPAVTYSFSNSTTADATSVNQNFTDLISGMTDGSKDFSISALTLAGTFTANGHVNLGNASGDDLSITASLASSLAVKTNSTYNVGSATLGLLSIYFGGASTFTARILASSSQSATYTLTLPTTVGTKGHVPYNSDGAGVLTWAPGQTGINAVASANYTILDGDGYYAIMVTTGAADRTITLPTAASTNAGRRIMVMKVDSGVGKVLLSGTINGISTSAYNEIGVQYGKAEYYSDGSAWYYSQNKDVGLTDGNYVSVGWPGEYSETTASTSPSGGYSNSGAKSLTPGIWLVWASGGVAGASTSPTQLTVGVHTASGAMCSEKYTARFLMSATSFALNNTYIGSTPRLVNVGTATNYYGVALAGGGTGLTLEVTLFALRVV